MEEQPYPVQSIGPAVVSQHPRCFLPYERGERVWTLGKLPSSQVFSTAQYERGDRAWKWRLGGAALAGTMEEHILFPSMRPENHLHLELINPLTKKDRYSNWMEGPRRGQPVEPPVEKRAEWSGTVMNWIDQPPCYWGPNGWAGRIFQGVWGFFMSICSVFGFYVVLKYIGCFEGCFTPKIDVPYRAKDKRIATMALGPIYGPLMYYDMKDQEKHQDESTDRPVGVHGVSEKRSKGGSVYFDCLWLIPKLIQGCVDPSRFDSKDDHLDYEICCAALAARAYALWMFVFTLYMIGRTHIHINDAGGLDVGDGGVFGFPFPLVDVIVGGVFGFPFPLVDVIVGGV